MSYATIRAVFETALDFAYSSLPTPVPVLFDAVQETPPNSEHVILSIGFPSTAEPVICSVGEGNIEYIRGSIQVSCYTPKGRGMKRLEELAQVAAQTLVQIPLQPDVNNVRPRVSNIEGPTPILSGDQPYGLSVISAVFTAKG
jgi:hypothetical protein